MPSESRLIPPCGGALVDLTVAAEAREELHARAARLPSVQLSDRAVCDLELLATGGFSPLDRFMGRDDYRHVLGEMRLASGALFPIPVTLPVDEAVTPLHLDQEVALRDARRELLAVMTIEEVSGWSPEEFAREVLGTTDVRHPLVVEMRRWGRVNVSGALRVLRLPRRHDFPELRLTPAETRARLAATGRPNVVAFQTRDLLHRLHEELTKRAIRERDGVLLLDPVVGMTEPSDVDHYTRVRGYRMLAERYYERDRVVLALLPLAMRMAGPREALWHAIVRRNHGANHLILERDHASPGADSAGRPFYGPDDAQQVVQKFHGELGVAAVPSHELIYLPDEDRYEEVSRVPRGIRTALISGTQVREEYLNAGRPLPTWFTRPEVAEILAQAHPPRHRQGVCVWLTGLPGSGKSATAEALTVLLLEHGRRVTRLDSDLVRTHLSKGLGFRQADRATKIRRIGFVAAEIVRHGGIAVCATVSPYRATRNEVRGMVGADRFVEVFVDTPLEICDQRHSKGAYARAHRGEIEHVTVHRRRSSRARWWAHLVPAGKLRTALLRKLRAQFRRPYEPPESPDLVLDTVHHSAEENGRLILELLARRGFVRAAA